MQEGLLQSDRGLQDEIAHLRRMNKCHTVTLIVALIIGGLALGYSAPIYFADNSPARDVYNNAVAPSGTVDSQAIHAGDFIFVSGQVGVDPETGVTGEGIANQTTLALTCIQNIVEYAGSDMTQVVSCTVYLTPSVDFEEFNAAYTVFFPSNPPSRSTIYAAALPTPGGPGVKGKIEPDLLLEISCIALKK